MENTQNVESTIHAIITDGSQPLNVTLRTREMLSIISSARVTYASIIEWLSVYWASNESMTDEAYNATEPLFEYLDKLLLDSISDNTMSVPFNGI